MQSDEMSVHEVGSCALHLNVEVERIQSIDIELLYRKTAWSLSIVV